MTQQPRYGKRSLASFRARSLRVEQLECRYLLDSGGIALTDDHFDLPQNGPQVVLDVLANDQFEETYEGQRLITSVSYGSEGGRIEIGGNGQHTLYTPPADFFGTESFVYAVDSEFTAQVFVKIQAPLAFDHYEIPPDGVTRQLDVLANDPFWSNYEGPRRITSVSVGSAGGTVQIGSDAQTIQYTPPEEAYTRETFIYVVDDLYPAQVAIEIPVTLKGDQYELVQYDPPTTLNVLANDPFWPGYRGARKITHVTESQLGTTLEISTDGKSILYKQEDGFSPGRWDSFRYVVDGIYEANVSLVLHRPVQDDFFELDENSYHFPYNVTTNDTYRDLDNREYDIIDRVTSVTQPESGGLVTISADGHDIVYTPPAGFTGSDTFVYVADGTHEATVRVQVTRPVRDDYLYGEIFQDTPDNVVDVLKNDFLGNGYDGPQLITEVGPTENGGVVTIIDDGKAILYTPTPGYTGQDHFSYTVDGTLEADATVNIQALAQHDSVTFCPNPAHIAYPIDVLENDHFDQGYLGPGVITSVELISGSGQASVTGGSMLMFTPAAAGSHSLRYTVDGQYETTVSVWIREHLDPDQMVVDQNSPAQSLDPLVNDFDPDMYYVQCKSQDYPGARLITGVTQSEHGGIVTVDADGFQVHYTPPADFVGSDSFTYTVDDFMTETVNVEVIRRVRDDQFRVDAEDGPQVLAVLVNDLFGADYTGTGQITDITLPSSGGTVTIAHDGQSIVYAPPVNFVGTDTFTYVVDGALKAEVNIVVDATRDDQLPTFESFDAYHQFLVDDALVRYEHLFGTTAWVPGPYYRMEMILGGQGAAPASNRSHSETNVQVAGVDEGDIVEFDSDYLYMLADNEVVIVDAWPAEELEVASRVALEGRLVVEYLHGDRLTVIAEVGGGFNYPTWDDGDNWVSDRFWPPITEPVPSSTIVTVIDVSNRTDPRIVQTTSMEGRYVDSRGVGDSVYLLVSNDNAVGPRPEIIDDDNDPTTTGRYETEEEYLARINANPGQFVEEALPNYTTYDSDGEMVRTGLLNMPENIYQPIVPDAINLTTVVSLNVKSDEPGLADTSGVYSTGASTIYASLNNFYVFDTDYADKDGIVTRIVKFDWDPDSGGVNFSATTTLPGTILNQFSADENDGYLRIATTVSNSYSGNWSGRNENMLFVLQEDVGVFEFVGSLQNLALDETMRSVRFLGDRAFVTTFGEVDPLFAIDMSDAANPQPVGHITLPGFTSYMHLIDQDHLLTVGRNTPAGGSGPTQVALFDIAELAQPRRIAEYTFPRFSTSEAELDHHAFGYYAEHGLLGMPVAKQYVTRVDDDGDGYRETRRWVQENQLAVFSVDVTASQTADYLELVSEIDHGTPVRRSGYIGDKLYSLADDSVKVVAVSDPATVIGELIVEKEDVQTDDSPIAGEPSGSLGLNVLTSKEAVTAYPATQIDDTFVEATERARTYLAGKLEQQAG
ncbi:MAG: beta-propeller domain-containing protein, partial [Pirellulaceae bacterium]|nr:beta-propeller domain-containing protein [Pirellulaceae bacterium]